MLTGNTLYKNDFLQTFFIVVAYALCFFSLQIFFHYSGFLATAPYTTNICALDGIWYKSIADHGYVNAPGGNNTAFYILFPLLWQVLHLGVWGICGVNILLFAVGFGIVCSFFNLSVTDKLFWLSMPSLYFCFVPYSEALFFMLSALCLLGIHSNKMWLVWVSLFFLSLTRATAIFFIPALLFMMLAGSDKRNWWHSLQQYFLHYFLPIVIGTAAFIFYQYAKTGVWFAYFAQQQFWDRKFRIPSLPFTGLYGSDKLLWLSALSLFACFVAFVFAAKFLLQWFMKGQTTNRLLLFSLGYLTMTMSTVFFCPTWETTTTNILGTNRYTMVNPFFFVFLYYFTREMTYAWRHYLGVFIACTFFCFLFGSYGSMHNALFFLISSILAVLYMFYSDKRYTWPVLVLTSLNIFLQFHLFQQYLGGIMTD